MTGLTAVTAEYISRGTRVRAEWQARQNRVDAIAAAEVRRNKSMTERTAQVIDNELARGQASLRMIKALDVTA